MSALLLFPLVDEPGAFEWARLRGMRPKFGRLSAGERLRLESDEHVTLIAPGEDVALHAVELPVRGEFQALAAARFAIEDDLAEPLDAVTVALGPRGTGLIREAFVVSRERLESWRAALAAAGVEVDQIVPDYAALSVEPDALLVVDLGDRVLVRGPRIGFAADAALAREALAAVLAARPELGVALRSDQPDALLVSTASEDRAVDVASTPDADALVRLLVDGLRARPAVDLAQAWRGGDAGGLTLAPWRAATGLAAAAALSFLALLAAQTATLSSSALAAEGDAERILIAAFPDIDAVTDPRAALRARLGASGVERASFLELSSLLAESLGETPAIELSSLRFDDSDGRLAASIVYTSYAEVQQLKAAIEARGGRLAEGASRLQGARTAGEIEVIRP